MLRLSNLKIPASRGKEPLAPFIADALSVPEREILSFRILRRSVDSRKKPQVFFLYTVAVQVKHEAAVLSRKSVEVTPYTEKNYTFPYSGLRCREKPVVVGMGPGGLFAALCLCRAGVPCILLEQGKPVEERTADVDTYWNGGALHPRSNVQFGEGGAGTFSDGKLTCGVSDPRVELVFRTLSQLGGGEEILWSSKPHVGTDVLKTVLGNLRQELLRLGCDIRFEARLTDIHSDTSGVTGITVQSSLGETVIPTRHLILAPGNSARETFAMLERCGITMIPKSFSIGVRIEHRQADIDRAQYGEAATLGTLPVSDYKLAAHLPGGRSIYTFCVCPGGSVVAAASEEGTVVTNGMSLSARDGENCNGGLLVSVTPEDFDEGVLGGVALQRRLEQRAYEAGGGNSLAPAQLVKDFLTKTPSTGPGRVKPTYRPGVFWCNLWDVLPDYLCRSLRDALPELGRKIRGFDSPEAVLTAVETRSSCPVRIVRDESFQSSLHGLYPCGEGAGYAGGIVSAAADGIRVAEAVCKHLLGGERA